MSVMRLRFPIIHFFISFEKCGICLDSTNFRTALLAMLTFRLDFKIVIRIPFQVAFHKAREKAIGAGAGTSFVSLI